MCAIQIRSAWDAFRGSCDVTIAVPLSEETPGCTWILFVVFWVEGNTMSFFQRTSRHSSSPERGGRFRRKLHLQCRNLGPSCAYKARVPLVRALTELSIPQPESLIIRTEAELLEGHPLPFFLKTDYVTASTGTWRVTNKEALTRLVPELQSRGLFEVGSEW